MANGASATASGIGFPGLLTVLFIALKLLGVIDWAWGWVLAPLWISAALVCILFGVVISVALFVKR